jgi:hypothetical protein
LRFSGFRNGIRLLLVLFLLFQLVALPVHEYSLRQQGYTLVYVVDGAETGGSTSFTSDRKNYYNIAFCPTHLQLEVLSSYPVLAFGLLVLGGLLSLLSGKIPSFQVQYDRFPSSIVLRAPPLLQPS